MMESWKRYRGLDHADDLVPAARGRDEHGHMIPMMVLAFLLLFLFLIAGMLRIWDAPAIAPFQIVSESAIPSGSPVLVVRSDGSTSFDDVTVSPAAVPEIARRMTGNAPERTLYIMAEGDMTASTILPLIKTLRDEGIESLRMIVINKASAE